MFKMLYTALVLWLAEGWALGQNLVLNPSFEMIEACFTRPNNGILAVPWRGSLAIPIPPLPPMYSDTFYGTLDLFHSCMPAGGGAPLSDIGFHYPHFGESYGGVCITQYYYLNSPYPGLIPFIPRDFAQGKLTEPLAAGVRYNFSVWVSLADGSAINVWQLGLRLTNNWYYVRQTPWDSITAPLYWENEAGNFIQQNSCDDWVQLRGSFVAQGSEQYFQFGSSVDSPTAFQDSIRIPKSRCYDQYNALYEPLMTFPAQWNEFTSYLFVDDFAIWREDKEVYHAQAGKDAFLCFSELQSVTIGSPSREQYHYFWLSEQGDTLGTTAQLTVSPSQTTTYILSQWDFKFDQTWDTVTVFVEPDCPELTLPNVFTPNGDGVHDVWTPIVQDIDQLEIQIFSRWGKLVHQYSGSASTYSGWDGGDSPDGTYFAVVKAKGYNGKVLEEKGTITLVR
jgi:gliding motility-associated-like protein